MLRIDWLIFSFAMRAMFCSALHVWGRSVRKVARKGGRGGVDYRKDRHPVGLLIAVIEGIFPVSWGYSMTVNIDSLHLLI